MDGDQLTAKVAYTIESNKELDEYINSKRYYIDLGGKNVHVSSNETVQALYNFTLILPQTQKKLTPIEFY